MKKHLLKKTQSKRCKQRGSSQVFLQCHAGHLSNSPVWLCNFNVLNSGRRNNKTQEHVNNITLH